MRRRFALAVLILGSTAPAPPATPLADAAERNDRPAVRRLIDANADVKQAQTDGMTALHWAARHDDLDACRLLLKAGADPDAVNRQGVTPLSLACTNGSGPIVDLLLRAGADPRRSLPGGETPLHTAARTGRPGPVTALLKAGAEVDARERRAQTPLMWAAAEGYAEVVDLLLQAGADFKGPLPSGFTPLFFAVREGRTEVVRTLLKAGADVNAPFDPKKAVGRGAVKGTSPLVLAVENGHFELAAALLDLGADPDDQRSGFTPLHTLTWVRKPSRGDGDDGDPAPVGSGKLDSLQLAEILVKHGADVNARLKRGASGRGVLGRPGASPFLLACSTADLPYMRILLRLGADPRLPNFQHATPLHAAAGVGSLAPDEEAATEPEALEAVALLISLGNDPNAVDDNGETPMHGAAYKSFPAVARLLDAKGARPDVWNRKDKHGWTPLDIAAGHRPGNFNPSAETLAALQALLDRSRP